MCYHASAQLLPGGFVGVDVFFAISGFVVTAALAAHQGESITAFIGGFYHRRLTRILPALCVVLIVAALAWVLLIPPSWLSGQAERVALAGFLGLSNWALVDQSEAYFAPRAEFSPFTHTWSLGVEEQFYLLAPWLIFLVWRFQRQAIALLAILGLASLACAAAWTHSQPTLAFYSIASRFWELAAGALWYLLLWHRAAAPSAVAAMPLVQPLGVALLAVTMWFATPQGVPFPWAIGAVLGTLALIGLPGMSAAPTARLLATAAMRWIGLRSYSLYLWHWPVFVLMRWTVGLDRAWHATIAMLLTLLAAEASYRWVERPLRRSARWHRMPALATNGVLVGAALLGAVAANAMFERRNEWGLSTVVAHAADWYALHHDPTLPAAPPCAANAHPAYRQLGEHLVIEHHPCAAVDGREQRKLFVLGDSHATAYLPMLHRLSVDESVIIEVHQIPGCPFLDLGTPMGTGGLDSCIRQSQLAVADVLARSRPGDVVFLASLRLPRFGDQWGVLSSESVLNEHFGEAKAKSRQAAIMDADQWLRPLLQHGLQLVLEAPKPIFRAPAFRCVDAWMRHNPICARGLVETRDDEQALREPVLRALRQVVSRQQSSQVTIFDAFTALCPDEKCAALAADGRPLYFDADHLSRWGNEVVYPHFRAHWRRITGAEPAVDLPAVGKR